MNNNIILIAGKSATGKSLSLRNLRDPEGVIYLNCENNKGLPFKSKFQEYTVTEPYQVHGAVVKAEEKPEVHTIIIDSLTYMMAMFETQHVLTSNNTMQAWGDYAQFFKRLMSEYVAQSTKRIIFTAHTMDVLNEAEMIQETYVKVKGSLMNEGIESYFSTIVASKKMAVKKLDGYESPMLGITEEEQMLGFKYVFQTKLTKDTVNERVRSSLGMWDSKETYIDNDVQLVLDRLDEYYS